MNSILSKILGVPIGLSSSGKNPKDGDGDGKFSLPGGEDNIPVAVAMAISTGNARASVKLFINADPQRKARIKKMFEKGFQGGFTLDKATEKDVKTGISVGRNRHGIRLDKNNAFDSDGRPKKEAIRLAMAWLDYHGEEVFSNPLNDAREVGIGGWLDGEDFYLDVVDIYENNAKNISRAPQLGKEQNQISVANLDRIQIALETDDWTDTTIDSGGDGAETLDLKMFDNQLDVYRTIQPSVTVNLQNPSSQPQKVKPKRKKSLIEELMSLENISIFISETKGK
jgi:hypothetical protein